MMVVVSGSGREERRRRGGRHEGRDFAAVHSGRQMTGGGRVMVRRIQDMVLVEIQRRLGALVNARTRQVVMMELVMVVLDALQVMVMAQLVVVVMGRRVLSVRDRDGPVMIHRSATSDSGHQILEAQRRVGRQVAATSAAV